VTPMASDRDGVVLSILLEHPYLHGGLTSEAAFHYLLGRLHDDRRQESWRKSARTLAFWMKRQGFEVVKKSQMNLYLWPQESQDTIG